MARVAAVPGAGGGSGRSLAELLEFGYWMGSISSSPSKSRKSRSVEHRVAPPPQRPWGLGEAE